MGRELNQLYQFLFISEEQSNRKAVVFPIVSSLVRLKQGEYKLKLSSRVSRLH